MYARETHDKHVTVLTRQIDRYLERIVVLTKENAELKRQNELLSALVDKSVSQDME